MSYLDITHAWKGTEYRSRLRKAERATRKAVLLAAMFLVGMTLGSVLSEPKTEPIQIASMD